MPLAQMKEGQMLFVKRDMFNDSGFPLTLMPATKEALLAHIVGEKLKEQYFESLKYFDIVIEQYGDNNLIVVQYFHDKAHGHWVLGFVRDGMPEGLELPFKQTFGPDDISLAEGYTTQVLEEADPEDRGGQPIHFWSKPEV